MTIEDNTIVRSATVDRVERPPKLKSNRTETPAGTRTARRILIPVLIALLLIVELYPLLWILSSSLKDQNSFLTEPLWTLPSHFDFKNYVDAWNTAHIGHDALNSLLVTVPSLFFVLVLGSGAAFALEVMVFKGRNGLLLLMIGGIMAPVQIILLPLFTIYFKLGITNSLWPLIITYVGHGLPLTVFLLATYFRGVPRELFEAATIDGANIFRAFFSVGLPLVRNGIVTIGMLQFFSIWNDLLIALTFNTRPELSTVQVGLLNFNGEYGDVNYGPLFAAISTTVFATLIVYVLINQQVMKGLTAGSMKG